jgi:hypothetical protein
VTGIGQQGQRVHFPAIERFDGNENGIQANADGEGLIEIGGRVDVRMAMIMVVMGVVVSGAHVKTPCKVGRMFSQRMADREIFPRHGAFRATFTIR